MKQTTNPVAQVDKVTINSDKNAIKLEKPKWKTTNQLSGQCIRFMNVNYHLIFWNSIWSSDKHKSVVCHHLFPDRGKPKAAKWLFTWIILFRNMCLVQPDTYNQDLSGIIRCQNHCLLQIPVVSCWLTVHNVGPNPVCYTGLSSSSKLCIFIGMEMLAVGAILILWPSCPAIIHPPHHPHLSLCCYGWLCRSTQCCQGSRQTMPHKTLPRY